MSKKIYVGNMPFSCTEDQIRDLFSQHGTVTSVSVITDRDTGRPRGFAFVEMGDGGEQAIAALNEHEIDGRSLNVNEARPRAPRSGGANSGWRGNGGW